jgi:uncharacterized protein (TIGR03083 family)
MRQPDPVQVLDLFPEERAALLQLLSELAPDEWERPTVCANWSVRDVASHILGGDLGNLSTRRDGFHGVTSAPEEELVAFVNRFNDEWVQAARRLSPQIIIDLLGVTGPMLFDYFGSLDLDLLQGTVSWAGLDPAPVGLDVAREYTERWLHQQHIRDAVGKPGLIDHRFLAPVLATFVYALPHTFRNTKAPLGAVLQLHIEGEAGGDWSLVREADSWVLYAGVIERPNASVRLDQSIAWRLFTKGLAPQEALEAVSFTGDRHLGLQVLEAVAIIA